MDKALDCGDVAQDRQTPEHQRYPSGQQSKDDQGNPLGALEQSGFAIEAAPFSAGADVTGQQRTNRSREDQQRFDGVRRQAFKKRSAIREG